MKKTKQSTHQHIEKEHLPIFFDTSEIEILKKHRCLHCNKLLGIEQLHLPSFDIKCQRCGHVNSLLHDYNRQVMITDKNGVILYINEEVEKVTGYSSKELLGKTPAVWGNQMPKVFYQKLWDEIAVEKRAAIVQVTNRHKNGTLYNVIMRISPILDINGNIELFIGMETIIKDKEEILINKLGKSKN